MIATVVPQEEFERVAAKFKPDVRTVLTLLRRTRRSFSLTDRGRGDMGHGHLSPKQYPDPENQELFISLIDLVRSQTDTR